jgi:hypothetical protein
MDDKKYKSVYRMLARFGFELLTIIAGILIALFVNNWQVRNHDRAMLASTLNSLPGNSMRIFKLRNVALSAWGCIPTF